MKTANISEQKIVDFINGLENSNIKICFDVDGTLIYNEDTPDKEPDTPRYDVIKLFHLFESIGCQLFVWSGGGIDYATRWALKLGLNCYLAEKGSFEPDIAIDDEYVRLGKVNIKV